MVCAFLGAIEIECGTNVMLPEFEGSRDGEKINNWPTWMCLKPTTSVLEFLSAHGIRPGDLWIVSQTPLPNDPNLSMNC